jgi:aminobenzoyl-glutamate utilization protein B
MFHPVKLPVCRTWLRLTALLFLLYYQSLMAQPRLGPLKKEAIQYINHQAAQLTACSDSIWSFAEKSFEEHQSAALLCRILRQEGFSVQEKVCGVASMFIATYGLVKPVIGLFGEYDADPQASNQPVPWREERVKGGYGHGAGHNLLAVGSLGTALALKSLIAKGKLIGSIRYFGTTAEGSLGGKAYLARDGYFRELDLSLYWHPSPVTAASTHSWDALVECVIRFSGEKLPAFREDYAQKNPLNALAFFMDGVRQLNRRNPRVRINYSVLTTGKDLQYTPDTVTIRLQVQGARQAETVQTFRQVEEITRLTASLNEVSHQLTVIRSFHEFVVNVPAMKLVQENMQLVESIRYTATEQAYARQMQEYLGQQPEGMVERILPFSDNSQQVKLNGNGSDIGDASWIAPEIYFVVCCLPPVPMHCWPTTAFTAHSIGHKGMLYAAQVMAAVAIDYLENKALQAEIRKDFEAKTNQYPYQSLLKWLSPPVSEYSKTR